jgi:hypothetical protein
MTLDGTGRLQPQYFERVRVAACHRWEQLESDPDLAGPWRQLFAQVQRPRHVLSELLQNADDAGASLASARIDGDVFVFEHDGEDFDGEQFASLCRFGFSNKRKLHTIGFRGVGFKSTFSLGRGVEVLTPTIAIKFDERRFTEPIWVSAAPTTALTCIRVRIEDPGRQKELEKNLNEWAGSPASLLFFQNIRKLVISGREIKRKVVDQGPAPDSEIVDLSGSESVRVLVIHSPEQPFPNEAIAEIRQERITEDITLPPCRVEIVLGLKGAQRLFVILPTEVRADLPFSCNAPFLQDPARTGIKDPAISPTNRWLLDRLGDLAAKSMIDWLFNTGLSMPERAGAYALLPLSGDSENTVAEECEHRIKESFVSIASRKPVLLTSDGNLRSRDECIAPPGDLYAVWTPAQLVHAFGKKDQSVLAAEISSEHRECLVGWKWLETISPRDILSRLERTENIPKPDDWQSLSFLWSIVLQWASSDWDNSLKKRLKILPAEGFDNLLSSRVVVRLSSGKSRLSNEDWRFVTNRLHILDREWLNYLSPQREKNTPPVDGDSKEPARKLLQLLGLAEPTSPDVLVVRAYQDLRQQETFFIKDMVRITHIMASLGAAAPTDFEYVTRDERLRKVESGLSADLRGELEYILPKEHTEQHLLHSEYSSGFHSCTRQQWENWVCSEKSGLCTFVGFAAFRDRLYGQHNLKEFIKARQGTMPTQFHLRTTLFYVDDYDFDQELIAHWTGLASSETDIWVKVVRLIAEDPTGIWIRRKSPKVVQSGRDYEYTVNCGTLVSKWILRLRDLPCLQDTHGFVHVPAELLLRTPETEALLDVEPFVRAEMDTPAVRDLLKLLGVRDSPTSLDKLIDRLRSLATVDLPPIFEIAKWYHRLDQILPRCSSDELAHVKATFASERLILTNDLEWGTSGEVFQYADEQDIPGTPTVHPTVQPLSIWTRLVVAERPTVDLIIDWLKQLESGTRLDVQGVKRVTAAIQRCSMRVWEECSHWLSLDRSWAPTSEISFRLTMQRLTPFAELFPGVRAKTADLRMLSSEACSRLPFSALKDLGEAIENRITDQYCDPPQPAPKPWMMALANGLQRIKLSDENQTALVRAVAARLAKTAWQPFRLLRVTPYIDGTPAGQAFEPNALWHDHTFYVRDDQLVKLFNAVVDELARPFGLPHITESIRSCVERDHAFVDEYLESNFTLEEVQQPESFPTAAPPGSEFSDAGQPPSEGQLINVDTGSQTAVESPLEEIEPETQLRPDIKDTVEESPKPQPPPKPPREKPSLIERYAASRGYKWDSDKNRYIHPDGFWLQKSDGSFSWERYSSKGDILCRYWVSEQCLLTGGIEMGVDLWELIRKLAGNSALILVNSEDHPVEITGNEIVRKVDTGEVVLYPAKYRLCIKPGA